jgi:hypothetical protein
MHILSDPLRVRLKHVTRQLVTEAPDSPAWRTSMDELEALAAVVMIEADFAGPERFLSLTDYRALIAQ